jgi:hypothetical protein
MSWPVARAVDELAVDEDVAVHDGLAGLRGRAGEPGAQHEGVEALLEQLDEVLTGQAGGAAGLVEDDAELLLADAVLGAQALLLAEADGVVAVGLALRAAVLAGRVGALLEVARGLRGQRDAEGAGETGLAAGPGLGGHVPSGERRERGRSRASEGKRGSAARSPSRLQASGPSQAPSAQPLADGPAPGRRRS